MTTTLTRPEAVAVRRPAGPGRWLAAVGVGFLALQGYAFTRWILSGNAVRTPDGEDPIPGWMRFAAHAHEVIGVSVLVGCAWFLLIRPWRRDGRPSTTGLLVVALLTCEWQDLLASYFNHVYTYNTAFLNWGAWYSFIPGWTSPRANHLAEPILFALPMMSVAFLLPAMVFSKALRKVKARHPQLRGPALMLIALGMGFTLDVVLECFWARIGLYAFTGTIPSLTVFSGHYYQFPIYEAVLMGALFATFGCLLYFRNDNGETVAERGLPPQRTARRFLALAGFANLAILAYNALFAFFTLLPGFTWATDIVENRSYLRDQVCGEGTTYACPGKDIPIPRRGQPHVNPAGELVDE